MRRCLLALPALVLLPGAALAQPATEATPTRIEDCRALKDKPGELECYRGLPEAAKPGLIADEWRLRQANLPTARLVAHRPAYLILRGTDRVNQQPTRVAQPQDFQPAELKLQISFRGEFFSPEQLGDRWRLWYAYTQQSNWQAFNSDSSRPFRDTSYEPEVILTYNNTGGGMVPWQPLALVNLGVVHQSNGRSGAESRTWWRTYLQGGWQLGAGSLLARIWDTWREGGMKEDNPDIADHVGRADLMFRSKDGGWHLLLRSNARPHRHRGFAQLDWRTPWTPLNIPVHLQLTHGYGETLLDYNHKQTTVGLGFSFWEW